MHLKYRKNLLNRSRAGNVAVYLVLILVGAFLALPLVYALVTSLKPYEEIFIFPPRFYVVNPTTANFRDLFVLCSQSLMPFSRSVFNSVLVSLVVTVAHVALSSMAAYPLAKNDFPGKDFLFSVIVGSLLFVGPVTALPQYILMSKIGLINTLWSVILPNIGSAMGLFLMKQFMEQIPLSIIEAPRIDGATEFDIAFKIVFPNVKPAWLTLGLLIFQTAWNNTGATVLFDDSIKLLPTVLSEITTENALARMGVGMAATVFLMIPPIAFFIISQSKVVKTMAFAGIKE